MDNRHLSPTEENYISAWNLTANRREDPCTLFTAPMYSPFNTQFHENESSERLKSSINFADLFVIGLRRWEVLNETCGHWLDRYLTTELSTIVEQVVQEKHLCCCAANPVFKRFETFPNGNFIVLEAVEYKIAALLLVERIKSNANSTAVIRTV